LTLNQEKIKVSLRAMGRIENYILKQKETIHQNQAVYQLYSEDIAIATRLFHGIQTIVSCPEILVKCKSMLNGAKQKLLFLLVHSQIESIKSTAQISPYTTFTVP
jgi:Cu(I)/Ag(I) efflux system membrane fusion protein